MTIYKKRADARKMCERLESIINLTGASVTKTINSRENEYILTEICDGTVYYTETIQYRNREMAFKYSQYSYFVTGLQDLFSDSHLNMIDVSLFDTSNVISLADTFRDNDRLKEIKGLEYWDTSKVRTALQMFDGCTKLEKIDLTSFNLTNCEKIYRIFTDCESLKEIKGLENLGHTKTTELSCIFMNCRSLEDLDLSNWDVTKIDKIFNIFRNCVNLKNIKFTGWELKDKLQLINIFKNCISLEKIVDCYDERLQTSFKWRDIG